MNHGLKEARFFVKEHSSQGDPDFNKLVSKRGVWAKRVVIEILVVLAIIMVLIALLLPAVRTAGPAARRSQCVNNLKHIGLALRNYQSEHGTFPPVYTVDAAGKPLHSWRTLILPYVEQKHLYDSIDLSRPWNDPVNAKAFQSTVQTYSCPEEKKAANGTTYLGVVGPTAFFSTGVSRRLEEITDGQDQTLMVIEVDKERSIPWMAPIDADERLVLGLGPKADLYHSGGVNALFASGTVRFLKATVPDSVRHALITIAGDDKVSNDKF